MSLKIAETKGETVTSSTRHKACLNSTANRDGFDGIPNCGVISGSLLGTK